MATVDEALVDALAARIAAGETIRVAELPADLTSAPAVQRLLRFARVAQLLSDNTGARAPEPEAPDRIGPWKLLRLLGSGGMGDVWLGERTDGTVEHQVAIKRVRGASLAIAQRLEAERRILAKLSHPNIARFIDAGVDATGAPWLALEYVQGVPLTEWLDRERPSMPDRLRLFLDLSAAVEHAHRHLVIHRDLKPANVLVDAHGVPRLLDFGIAKLLDGANQDITAAGLTPAYAAPEQLRGGEVSTATDVYALGLLLYRMLVGDLPATRRDPSMAAIINALDQEETQRPSAHTDDLAARQLPYPLSHLRGDIDAIISKAIRARPELRYATVRELASDIQRHLAGRPVEARVPTRWYLMTRFARRHRGALSVTMTAVIGILFSLGLALWQAHRADLAARQAQAEALRADSEAARAQEQAQRAEEAARFLISVFRQIDPFRRDARGKISLEQAFEDALTRIDREFQDRPQLAIDLNDDFGETLINLGRFDEARVRLDQARTLAQQHLSPEDPRLAEILLNQADLAARSGHAVQARGMVEQALATLSTQNQPVRLAQAKFALASILLDLNQADAAEPLVREAIAAYRVHLPDQDPRQAQAVFNLAQVHRHQRKEAEAKPLIDEAVRRAETLQGAETATLIEFLDAQRGNGNALLDQKREREAVDRMLAVARHNFPGDHPLHAKALIALGTILLRDYGDDTGETMLREAATMLRRLDHPNEARAWRMIGWTRNYWERYDLAIRALNEGHDWCLQHDPAQAECLAIAAERVNSLVKLKRGDEAIAASAALDAVIAANGALGMDTREMADEARAEALFAGGKPNEAVAIYDRLLRIYTERYGPTSNIVTDLEVRRDQIAAAAKQGE